MKSRAGLALRALAVLGAVAMFVATMVHAQSLSGVGKLMNASADGSGAGGGMPAGTIATESDQGLVTESNQFLIVE